MNARRLLWLVLLSLGLGLVWGSIGCKRPPQAVAVTPCPPPPELPPLIVPVDLLQPGDPPDVVARAYVASIRILRQAVKDREALLDAYRPRPAEVRKRDPPKGP